MTLALRRFPDRITRRRHGPGDCNSAGEYVKGMVEEVELAASVQPLSVEDVDVVGGARLSERLKVYVPEEGRATSCLRRPAGRCRRLARHRVHGD